MGYIKEFEGLRGLMALWVLLGHYATTLLSQGNFIPADLGNRYAVDVFILLSGFAIAAMIDKHPEPYVPYITRRILRIFPAYFLFLFLSALLSTYSLSVWQAAPAGAMREPRLEYAQASIDGFLPHLLVHLTALQAAIPGDVLPMAEYTFLGQAWSISLEWQFYLIAPALLWAMTSKPTAVRIALLIAAALWLGYISKNMPNGFIGRSLPVFIIGIGTFEFMKRRASETLPRVSLAQIWLVLVFVLLLSMRTAALPFVIWVTVVIAVIATREGKNNIVASAISSALNASAIQHVGKLSYSIYPSHMIVIVVCLDVLRRVGATGTYLHAAALLALVLPLTLLVSWVSFTFFEKPFNDFGKGLFKSPAHMGGFGKLRNPRRITPALGE